jgi:class 3 adenylate cyclase
VTPELLLENGATNTQLFILERMAWNDRLDYFGSTINVAARLEGQSTGLDVIVSDAVCRDPEVTAWLADQANELRVHQWRSR